MKTKRLFCTIFLMGILATGLLYGCTGIPLEEYDRVKSNLETTQVSLEQTTSALETTKASLEQTTNDLVAARTSLEQATGDLKVTRASLEQAQSIVAEREATVNSLENRVAQLGQDLAQAEDEYYELSGQYMEMEAMTQDLLDELDDALTVPYTAISGREITYAFRQLDGSTWKWTLDIDTYRARIESPEPTDKVTLNTDSGPVVMADFTKFVRPWAFETVVASLFERSEDEYEFAKEAFNIVTQLTVYSEDIGEDPRWPIETLTEAGGDCEDLAILYASLLKAAPYPYDIELVYMDSDNPDDPQEVNHVIVTVATDDWRVLSECTNNEGFRYWESVSGWFFEP